MGYQEEKKLVRNYYDAMEKASPDEAERVLARFTSEDYNWKGVYPFREQNGAGAAAEVFWTPLKKSTRCIRLQNWDLPPHSPVVPSLFF